MTPASAGGFFTTEPSGKHEPVEMTHDNGTDEGCTGTDEVKGLNVMWVGTCMSSDCSYFLIERGRKVIRKTEV